MAYNQSVFYSLDGKDFYTNYKVIVSSSSGMMDLPKTKLNPHSWEDAHGECVDTGVIYYEARDIILDCIISGTSRADFAEKWNAFSAAVTGNDLKQLVIKIDDIKPLVYMVYLKDGIQINKQWQSPDEMMFGTFTLRLREPEPLKRIFKLNVRVVIYNSWFIITNNSPINIYWGDGQTTFGVIKSGTIIYHEYTELGTYYAVFTGDIDNLTVSSLEAVVWDKLL